MSVPGRLVCIPSTDTAFGGDARRIADALPAGLDRAEALEWFSAELSRAYPTAIVREQDELALVKGAPPVWYVTRREHRFRIDTSVWVPLLPAEAYRFYVEEMPDWQSAVTVTPRHVTPGLVGTEYDASYMFLGREFTGVMRIVGADPGRSVSIEAEGMGISVWYATSFVADESGTRVSVKGDYDLPDNVIARIADRLGLERAIRRDIDRANESYVLACRAIAEEAERPLMVAAGQPSGE
jgi:hypothetical protein